MDEEDFFNHDTLSVTMCKGEHHSSRSVNQAKEVEVMIKIVEIWVGE